MKLLGLLTALLTVQLPTTAGMYLSTFDVPDLGEMRYAISLPDGYDPRTPRPLVLALHPGGERIEYYGAAFVEQIVGPALSDLDPIIVAPDCPTDAWTDPVAERAVLMLVRATIREFNIDDERILVTGFSLGGRGTWHLASRHPDLFTAAIPMASSTGDIPVEELARAPTYVIHGTADEVAPFGPARQRFEELENRERPVEFRALAGITHYQMGAYIEPLRDAGHWVEQQWAR